ncbi:MAG: sugar kinase, partial [Clostridia bacterium]|nr:sugar kinase [Clostridia bacterium]
SQIPAGSEGLIMLPYFLGERMPIKDPNAKGVIFGLNLRHTRGHIMKAAYEGMGYGLDQNLELLRKAGVKVETVTSVGGGTKAPEWLQTISDVCGIRQIVPEVTIGASYGDAMLAGIGIGALTPADIKKVVKHKYTTEPDMEKHAKYEPMKKHFAELYKRNADIMHDL